MIFNPHKKTSEGYSRCALLECHAKRNWHVRLVLVPDYYTDTVTAVTMCADTLLHSAATKLCDCPVISSFLCRPSCIS